MDSDRIKKFFVQHVEKIAVALFTVAALFLIYSGLQQEQFDESQPEDLRFEAQQVRDDIDTNHNEAIIPERTPTLGDIVKRTNDSLSPVDHVAYKLDNTWEIEEIDSAIRREDPLIAAPMQVVMTSYTGSYARRSGEGTYELTNLEAAERPEPVKKRKPKKKKPQMADPYGGYGGEFSDGEEEEIMDYDYAEDSMAAGSVWKVDEDVNFGINPMPVENVQSSTSKDQPVPELGRFIIGAAVVPHRKIAEAFEAALRDADGYDARRDQPIYLGLQVQRADVTDKSVDELTEQDWTVRADRKRYLYQAATDWAGFCKELIPAEFREDSLTTYLPPIMMDDYRSLASHPLIPDSLEESETEEQEEVEQPFSIDDLEIVGAGGTSSYNESEEFMDYESDMGYGGRSMSNMPEADPVDYKLIRFNDWYDPKDKASPKPGRRYVYRVRISLMDPNFPQDPRAQPSSGTLSADVYRRVLPLLEKSRGGKREPGDFQMWSEWSEPSAPAMLAPTHGVFTGPVNPPKRIPVSVPGGGTVEYERGVPEVEVVISEIHPRYKVRVPLLVEVTEGSILSGKGDASVIDPITMEVKNLPEAEVSNESTILDIEGGAPLSISKSKKMTEPGMMLLFDPATGELKVTGERGDQRRYRVYSYAKERGI